VPLSFALVTLRMSPPLHRIHAVEWPLFADVPPDDVRRLLAVARRRTFARGEVVFHRDDPADSLHLVVRGRFGARILTPLGDTVLVDVLGPGQSFGELALIGTDGRRSATVEAFEAGETRSVFRDDFAALQRKHPGVKDVLLRLLAEQLRRSTDRVVEAHYVDAETRVRRRVSELAASYDDGVVPLTQEDIAALAGTSRATVNRVLREEQRLGVVALARGRATVLDREALERRSRRTP
jgi:CRP/FNR family transcriptional regulator, cyclic AMP receptor protein